MSDSPDTAHSAFITDHHFVEKAGEPWAVCQYTYGEWDDGTLRTCGMSIATHALGPIKDQDQEDQTVPQYLQDKCMLPLEDDDSPGGDGMIYCFMDKDHEGNHGDNTIDEAGLAEMARGVQSEEEAVKAVEEHVNPPRPPQRESPAWDEYYGGPKTKVDEVVVHHTVPPITSEQIEKAVGNREEILESGGHKDDDGRTPFFFLPWDALAEVAYVMQYGAKKYAAGNYRKGMKSSRLFSACMRHWVAWWRGEKNDPETGKSHLAHAACCVLMLLESEIIGTNQDDRYVENK